jgi:hypothetical protein
MISDDVKDGWMRLEENVTVYDFMVNNSEMF